MSHCCCDGIVALTKISFDKHIILICSARIHMNKLLAKKSWLRCKTNNYLFSCSALKLICRIMEWLRRWKTCRNIFCSIEHCLQRRSVAGRFLELYLVIQMRINHIFRPNLVGCHLDVRYLDRFCVMRTSIWLPIKLSEEFRFIRVFLSTFVASNVHVLLFVQLRVKHESIAWLATQSSAGVPLIKLQLLYCCWCHQRRR